MGDNEKLRNADVLGEGASAAETPDRPLAEAWGSRIAWLRSHVADFELRRAGQNMEVRPEMHTAPTLERHSSRIPFATCDLQSTRLAWLAESIRVGTYRVDADRVAASIIDHMIR